MKKILAVLSVLLFLTGIDAVAGKEPAPSQAGRFYLKTDPDSCVYIMDMVSNAIIYSNDTEGLGSEPMPLGSVVKIYSLIAKYRNHPVDPDETYFCPGYGRDASSVSKCWLKNGHGKIGLMNAIAQSCNTYFYHFVQDIDFALFLKTLRDWEVLKGSDNWGRSALSRDDQYRAMIGKLDILRIQPLDLMISCAKIFGRDSVLPNEVREVLTEGMSLCYRNGTVSHARKKLGMSEDLPVICKTGTGMYEKNGEVSTRKTSGVFIGIFRQRYVVLALARGSIGPDRASLLGLSAVGEMREVSLSNRGGDR
jgi:hypothetical protein